MSKINKDELLKAMGENLENNHYSIMTGKKLEACSYDCIHNRLDVPTMIKDITDNVNKASQKETDQEKKE